MDRLWTVTLAGHAHDRLVEDYGDTPETNCYYSMVTLQYQLVLDNTGTALQVPISNMIKQILMHNYIHMYIHNI